METAKLARQIIDDSGRKQSWVADQMNISRSALNLILNGKRSMTADELIAFCIATETDPRDFMPKPA